MPRNTSISFLLCCSILALLLTTCMGSEGGEELDRGLGRAGARVVAPRLVPAPLSEPQVVLPGVSRPGLASAPVVAPRLERPALVDPDLLDPYQVDLFLQKTLVVDVLWVVDNSGSMANERRRLASSFENFIRVLLTRRIDYHVGVVSTQVGAEGRGGELREVRGLRYIDPGTEDAVEVFGGMVDFPPGRERLEQGLEAMRLALSEPALSGPNRGFLRPRSALAVMVVSDEDDGSFGQTSYFARFLRHSRRPGDEGLASFSAIVGLPPDGCIPEGEEHLFGAEADPGERYLEVMEQTGGLSGSICETDFDPLLQALGQRVSNLTRIFPLSSLPKPETLSLRVDGQLVPPEREGSLAWSYRSEIRSVVFEEAAIPVSGSEVRIAYVVDAGVAQ